MRSWVLVLLLAALLAVRLRLGSAEGDPLPPSLVDLVRDSPISSMEDLKLLLQQETNAIEDDEDEHDIVTNHTHGRYIRSLVEAQPAQQAACKVRTEVMEVTRSMLDRRNANFLLWPPCVEVQRCSGCCNTRLLQCVPIVTSSRYLQVIKIQYINRKAHYDKAIISVEDHVTCRCQPSSSASSTSSSTSQTNPNPPPPPPPPQQPPASSHHPVQHPRPIQPKTHTSKADLHRHDDLKHNQHHYLSEEREPVGRQWQQGGYTQLVHWTQPRVHQATTHVQTGVHQTIGGMAGPVNSWPAEARAEHSVMGNTQQVGQGSGYDGSKEESSVHVTESEGDVHHPDHTQRQQQLLQHQQRQQYQQQYQYHSQPHYPQQYNHGGAEDQELRAQYHLNAPQSDSASPPATPTQLTTPPLTISQKDSVTSQKNTEVTIQKQTQTETVSQKQGNEREESGSANSGDSVGTDLVNQGKEKDSKVTSEDGSLTEEERRQKLLEMVQREPDKHLHPHPPQHRPKPTTFKTAFSAVTPKSPAARQAPFRPASPRRRRKHRKRISKAAMRAMIM
ncbi:transcription factor SPT20 homolog [Parambassis ranga]|uniref:Transcription factor SPT20 homolog n=1 Tax=Parambassis ranga TaxID=210632 RepID=A0A6P7IKG5_9TELE|nr:transcription factor SPT20 homolog [Parambassis ranga]XP_028265285.1 transcription factor SPT20 homolog [Parambassis ranga]